MKTAAIVVCGCACVVGLVGVAGEAQARTYVIPHVLDTSGDIRINGGAPSPFDLGGFTTSMTIEEIGPGENGEFIYSYASPIMITGSDSFGRSFSLSLEVISAMTRPEGNGFRSEFFIGPSLVSFNGEPVQGGSGGAWELSVFGFDPQPLDAAGLIFDTPITHFSAMDGSGRGISVDMDAGQLRLAVPSPITAAVLAVAGLFGWRKRRDS